ncbi:phosphotransferase family protein [Bradyrhizobium vignae]|uniref:phosphotransferase family protein n=1 Tax=Bradyrhizobium vignae TaxID=1549949 RepID=UPI00100BC8C1|nr:phosphotransferase family protein [Bradyrhizobium vignae]RXH06657.1 phosphotransferase family protein [Bradyrhizobium vignae]
MASLANPDDEYSGTKAVEATHRIDEVRLADWMKANVEGFEGPIRLSQFRGGQSNPTYRLDTPTRSYVLRRKPFGKLLPSAHAVDREYRVINALYKQGFPVPPTFGLCSSEEVIGAHFYVMAFVQGRIFWNQQLPSVERQERWPIYLGEIQTLAKLHNFEPASIGLGDYGRPGNYFARQVDRWTKQYRASETQPIPEMERLIEWLPRTVPKQARVSVVHGDYRLDNMVFATGGPEVVAVLDWELSTLGDPLADFTYLLLQWISSSPGRVSLYGANVSELNIPDVHQAIEIYGTATGMGAVANLDWYFAYNLFRLAGIAQGIAGRLRDGTASSARALEATERVAPMAKLAWRYAMVAGAQ